MTPTHVALIALLSFPVPWKHAGPTGAPDRVDGWTLRVQADRFTGAHTCRLWRGGIDYQRQALVFHLPASIDTAGAVYRIDGGPAVPAASDEPELAALGFALHDDDLDNPSGGLVRIPSHRLTAAEAVKIEAAPGRRPVKFRISGLTAALAAARQAGCAEADFKPVHGARR
jgi:hypothetical protein